MNGHLLVAGLAVAGLGLAAPGSAWAQRILVDQPELRISTAPGSLCGEPMEVRVEARDPGIYEHPERELQPVIDAVRAVLTFECRSLPALGISGTLAGMQDEIFYAVADPESDWRLVADRAVRVTPGESAAVQPGGSLIGTELPPPATFAVAGLSIGMSLDEAMATLERDSAGQPRYDDRSGTLSMRERGCPVDFDWNARTQRAEPGWWCLDAAFSSAPDAWLREVRLAQALANDRRDQVVEALVERYGPPTMQFGSGTSIEMNWGQRIDSADVPDFHEDATWPLSASIDADDRRTVLLLHLRSADAPGQDDDLELRF